MTGALNDASGFWHALPQLVAQQVGNLGYFGLSALSEPRHISASWRGLRFSRFFLMVQALAEQACQEESQEESSTLMQLSHRDLDQR